MEFALAIGGVLLAAVAFTVTTYNRLVKLRNRVDQGWAQIDVHLQRRHDLIPNLVAAVKGYAAHEQAAFLRVVEARNTAVAADQDPAADPSAQAHAEQALTGALRQLFALSEAYPDLKADANFRQLQTELAATEDRVAYARQYYNAAVQAYATATQQFPAVAVAGPFGFGARPYFETDDAQVRTAPTVEF